MHIILKQSEIVAAIRASILGQGFDLTNKTLEVNFTAGRLKSGTSAEVIISDIAIPGDEVTEVAKAKAPALAVVSGAVASNNVAAVAEPEPAVLTDVVKTDAEEAKPAEEATTEGDAPKTTTSLFA